VTFLLAQKTRFKSGGTIGLTASPIEATTLNQLDATSTLPKENSPQVKHPVSTAGGRHPCRSKLRITHYELRIAVPTSMTAEITVAVAKRKSSLG
ncbi:MAG: hypothetical protein IJ774_10545, partial [Selenomonadaceae bacterium]|nr:hypothetical protein [Selenomonadaceae bacterium]